MYIAAFTDRCVVREYTDVERIVSVDFICIRRQATGWMVQIRFT